MQCFYKKYFSKKISKWPIWLLVLVLATVFFGTANAQTPGGVSTNLTLWLRANAGVTGATNASAWADQSTGGNNVTQATGGSQPVINAGSTANGINFNPVLTFDGTADIMSTAAAVMTEAECMNTGATDANSQYIVFRKRGADQPVYTYSTGGAAAFDVGFNSNGNIYIANKTTDCGTPPTLVPSMISFNGISTTGSTGARLNGTAGATVTGTRTASGNQRFWIGGRGTTLFNNCDIAEVINYNASQAANVDRIETYLAVKYGIHKANNYVHSGGTTIWNATTNATWHNDVAGIGRDDMGGSANTGLVQKQSTCTNGADIVTMGLGTIATTNLANSNTFSANQSYLIWGRTTGAIAWQSTESPSVVRQRLTREWKTSETGTVGSVQVRVPDNSSTLTNKLPAEVGSAVYLLTDADGDFSSGATEYLMTLNGTNWETTVDLTDGQFFTFATRILETPGGVTGAAIWLKANTGVTTGATLTWADQSGNSRNGVQATATNQPTLTATSINYNPALTFDGTNDYLTVQNLAGLPTGAAQVEEFAVANNLNTAGNWQHILVYGTGSSTQMFSTGKLNNSASAITALYGFNAASSWLEFTGGAPVLLDGKYTGTEGWISTYGTFKGSVVSSANKTTAAGYVGVDAALAATTHWNGNIPEVILYPTNLAAGDAQKVNSYLAIKYGITLYQTPALNYLASDASVIWNGTTNSANKENIAGIGRDDLSALNQKQSRSVNTTSSGDLVAMGLGTIATNNTANSNTFSADKNFMIWGDNGSANAWQSTESPASRMRLTREWKIQETGTVGSVQVRVQDNSASSGGELPAESTTVYLLTDADGDFSSGATEVSMTLVGTNWEVSHDFSNGQYFTFASQIPTAPGGVLNSAIWVKADLGVTTGATFTWTDQSGNSRNGVQSTATNQPTLTATSINYNPAVTFDGTNDYLPVQNLAGLPTGASPVEEFAVAKNLNTAGGWQHIFTYGTAASGQAFGLGKNTGNANAAAILYALDAVSTGLEFTGGAPVLLDGKYTGTSSLISTFGTAKTAFAAAANLTTAAGYIGVDPAIAAGTYWNGNIPEIILYPSNLTTTEVLRVNSYLAIKYGITIDQTTAQNYLASDASMIWNATTNAGFKNNIAGIGRDDLSALNQKQSKSVNTASSGDLVAMGLGTISTNNAANSNTFSADKNFMIWGDNAGANAWQSTESPSLLRQRLTREWKIQETGTVGSVLVRVQDDGASSGGELPAEITTVYLLTDADGDFTSGATETAMTLTGTNWEASFNFSNGQFFTFATQVLPRPGGVSVMPQTWFKADAGVSTSGAIVTSWTNQNTTNTAIPNVTGSTGSTYTSGDGVSYLPSIAFSVVTPPPLSSVTSTASDFISATAGTIYGVVIDNISATNNYAFGYGTSLGTTPGTEISMQRGGTVLDFTTGNGIGNAWLPNNGTYSTEASVISAKFNNNSTADDYSYFNGKAGTVGNAPTDAITNGKVFVGGVANGYGQSSFDGTVAEIASFNSVHSNADRNMVESYLAAKWGITLDQTTPTNYNGTGSLTYWNATTNAGYNSRITVIGRDDFSAFNKKQSKSIHSGTLVRLGLGTIAATNAANSNTFSTDLNFLAFGDNNGANTVQNTDKPVGTCGRMTRIFKVQETGTDISNVAVNFDLSTLSTTYGSYAASGLKLVVNSAASFSTVLRSYTASSYTSGIASFSGVDLDNGEFFTLAVQDIGFTPSVSSNSPVCAESALNLTANGGTTYSWAGPSGFSSVQQNPTNPSAQFGDAGVYSVTISNGFGCSAVLTTTVAVLNCDPTVCSQTICNNVTATGTINATDADGDILTDTLFQSPAHGTISIVGNNYTYTPTANYVGEDFIIIRSCDPSGACVYCVKNFVMQDCSNPPVCGTANTLTTCKGVAASGTLNATSPNGLAITYSIVSQPSSGTISLVGAVFTYTPVQGFEGSVSWVYRATTATGWVNCTVTIYVENCFEDCDGNGCAANLITGGTYPNGGSTLFQQNNIAVSSSTTYCYSITLTNNCAACPTTATVNFYAGAILLGTINYNELPLNVATVKGFSFSTNDIGNPATINFSVTQSGFGNSGTDILATSASLKIITGWGTPEANEDAGISLCKNSGAFTASVLSNDGNVSTSPTLTLVTSLPGATGTASVSGTNIIFTPSATFVGTASITYQICNGTCCDQAVLTIDVVEPAVSLSPMSVCPGNFATIIANVTGIDTTNATYQWQSSLNNSTWTTISEAIERKYTPASLTQSTYFRVIMSPLSVGCSAITSASALVSVVSYSYSGSAGVDQTHCNIPVFTMAATSASPGTGTWSVTSGTATISNVNSNTSNVTASTTNVSLEWLVNISGCEFRDTVALTSNILLISASNNGPTCPNSSLQLFSLPGSMVSYSWSGPVSFSSSLQNPVITSAQVVNSGTYTVTITDSTGCSASGNTTVTVNAAPATPGVISH